MLATVLSELVAVCLVVAMNQYPDPVLKEVSLVGHWIDATYVELKHTMLSQTAIQ